MCSSDIPDTTPAQIAATQSNERLANRSFDLQEQALQYFKAQQEGLNAFEIQARDRQLDIADKTAAQGEDVFNYQKAVFRPVEESLVAQAMRDSTPEYYERYAQEAATRIASAQGNSEAQFERDMSGLGVNPNSGAYVAGRRGLQIENAAQRGAGINEARDRAENLSFARRADVAGIGKGLVGAGNASYGLASSSTAAALSGANDTQRTAAVTLGTPVQYGQQAGEAARNQTQLAGDVYRAQAGVANSNSQAAGAAIGAIGSIAAAFLA
jgi:hypothetical protein